MQAGANLSPGFFDSIEHLPIHFPREASICGPVQYRWMYPFERYVKLILLSKLKFSVTYIDLTCIKQVFMNVQVPKNVEEHSW